MRALAEWGWFNGCLALGRLLRAGRYSDVRISHEGGKPWVRKRRRSHAPLLIAIGNALFGILGTGARILPQRAWEEREREMYRRLHDTSIRIDRDGTLVLPFLTGRTLAELLEDPELRRSVRVRAIELAVVALADFHRLEFTHGDAMAENVIVDLDAGRAHWIDFETVHDSDRTMVWRHADDVRALVATCLRRTSQGMRADVLRLILDTYADAGTPPRLVAAFSSARHRALVFHLGQAPLSLASFREIGCLLSERLCMRAACVEPKGRLSTETHAESRGGGE